MIWVGSSSDDKKYQDWELLILRLSRPNNLLEGFSIQKRDLSTLQQSIDTGLPPEFAKHKPLQRRLLSGLISKQDFDEGKVVAVKELDDGGILARLAKSNREREV